MGESMITAPARYAAIMIMSRMLTDPLLYGRSFLCATIPKR